MIAPTPSRQVFRQACVEANVKFPFNASWARPEVVYPIPVHKRTLGRGLIQMSF